MTLVISIVLLVFITAALFITISKQLNAENHLPRETCDHQWKPNYISDEAASIYDDGFNAYTDQYICTKCGKTKKGEKYYI